MKRLSKAILLSLVAILVAGMPILAAVAYRASYTIIESDGNPYGMLPVIEDVDNQWLADNGFMQDDALDTRIETLGGLIKPHMVAINKTLTAVPIPADSQTNLYFTTANTDLDDLDIITGYDGYITITDDDTLELGSGFEIEQLGYVDTDYIADKNLVYKEDSFRTYIDGATNITSTIRWGSSFPAVEGVNGGNDVVNQTNHTVNLPAGIEAGDLLLAFFASDDLPVITFPGGWTQLIQTGNVSSKFGAWYRVADGEEGATIVVTTDAVQMTAHTTYRISGYSGVPLAGTATGTSANPNPPDLGPTWGAEDTLWFVASSYGENLTVTAYPDPPDYTDGRNDLANHAEGCGVGTARQELNAVSEDPGTFTISAPQTWVAATVAIAPDDLEVTATGITSDEYTVKTYGVANEPAWATGDVLRFDGTANSSIDCGAIHNASAKLWVSFWLKHDSDYTSGIGTQYIWGKRIGAPDQMLLLFHNADGKLHWTKTVATVEVFDISSSQTSWTGGVWYYVLVSISDTVGIGRLTINGGAPVLTADVSPAPNGGIFTIGSYAPAAATAFKGQIQNVIVGTGDLSVDEEADLYDGIAPTGANAPTNYWYIDEGTGTNIIDYGTGGNDGTADTACSWETATFTTGSTGRLCDFYLEVADGITDPDRWGTNLKGSTVALNANDWLLNQNNVMPYMDYYKHTVSGVEHAWYQPNYMVEATDHDGEEDVGGSDTTITDATMTEAPGYWVGALVTITDSAGAALGESRVCTVFAATVITVAPAFSANIAIGDDFTIDFGTLIDRSYYGLDFDGVNDVVNLQNPAVLQITNELTVEFWVKFDSTQSGAHSNPIGKDHSGTQGVVWQIDVANPVSSYWHIGHGAGLYSLTYNTDLFDDTWHHIAVTKSATSGMIIYLDGSESTSNAAFTGAIVYVAGDWHFGEAAARFATMIGDGLHFYNRVLGPTEIAYNYNSGVGRYTPYSTSGLVGQWHMEEGSGTGAILTDSSGEGNTGTITGAVWANGKVPRPAGNGGTNDSRVTWGVNPTGVDVALGGMVSEGQPTPGALPSDPAQDILPETQVTDWYIEPDVGGTLLTNPLRPFVTMWSDNSTLTELQCWRIYALALILLVTVATAMGVGHHQGITMIMAGVALLGAVVLTIFPMWALVFAIGMFIGGLVMERSPSL